MGHVRVVSLRWEGFSNRKITERASRALPRWPALTRNAAVASSDMQDPVSAGGILQLATSTAGGRGRIETSGVRFR